MSTPGIGFLGIQPPKAAEGVSKVLVSSDNDKRDQEWTRFIKVFNLRVANLLLLNQVLFVFKGFFLSNLKKKTFHFPRRVTCLDTLPI